MEDATTKGSMASNTGQQREVAATVVQGGKVHTKMLVKKMMLSSTRCWFHIYDKCKFEGVMEYWTKVIPKSSSVL